MRLKAALRLHGRNADTSGAGGAGVAMCVLGAGGDACVEMRAWMDCCCLVTKDKPFLSTCYMPCTLEANI
jgi:hypothetical protein